MTEEEAIKKKNELERDDHDYKVTVIIKSYTVKVGEEKITISKSFSSKDEAQSYLDDLVKQGYDVSNTKITQKEVTVNVNLKESFDTLEEANLALEIFKKDNNVNDSDVKITKVRDESKDVITSGVSTAKYDTIDEANRVKEELSKEADGYEIYGVIRTETIGGTESETIESQQFDNREDALKFIDKLKNEGWDVSNLKVKLLTFEESIWTDEDGVVVDPGESDGIKFNYGHLDITLITKFTKIDSTGIKTIVNGNIVIKYVYVNGKEIEMNGLSKDPNSGLYEYTSKVRNGLNINNKSLVKIVGSVVVGNTSLPFEVEGYLSESYNVCKGSGKSKGFDLEFKEVTIINNKVLVDTKLVNKYKVVGTVSKEPTVEYYVDVYKKTYGYKYDVEAKGTKTFLSDEYIVDGEITKDEYETRYSLDVTTETKKYEKIYGTLIVKHIDTKGNELTNTIETTEIVGTNYVTSKKDFEGYEFIEVTGDPVEGKYIDGKLTVIYVYEFVDGKGGDDSANVPDTGIEDNNTLLFTTIMNAIILISTIIIRKRIN
ncbi:MAG: MucBP domain-containing protein [Bacilli bacterium]